MPRPERTERILFVDDEPSLLAAFQRQFRRDFALSTSSDPREALNLLRKEGPFAVIVSDMRMPGMDGVQFLAAAQEIDPLSVRMMLTGNADVATAAEAVNAGRVFQFLTKPCPTKTLKAALEAALSQYRLVVGERELLERTLHGSVKLLTDLLGMLNPLAFGRASRVKRLVRGVTLIAAKTQGIDRKDLWQFEMAAMLSQIGCVTLPQHLLKKVYSGTPLSPKEQELYVAHPKVGRELIVNIPRLEPIAEIIAFQDHRYDGSDTPPGGRYGTNIPLAARILKVVLDYDLLVSAGQTPPAALAVMFERKGWYDPALLEAMETFIGLESQFEVKNLFIKDVDTSMILAEDVYSTDDQLLVAKGFEISDSLLRRLGFFAENEQLRQPICVLVPVRQKDAAAREPAPAGVV